MVRKAKLKDANQIKDIINFYVPQGLLLPRSLNNIYENIRDFFVYEENNRILGVVSLHIYWEDLGEIKSLAVLPEYQSKGIGKKLIKACLKEGKELGLKKVFALTYVPNFFEKLGFKVVDKSMFPQKVWTECIYCVKFNECKEVPVVYFLG
ncbi:MAG: N-acetyltransferase [Persephonella sp.]|nr:MAG: N-acetyltransferase [Persephonella sp.]RUM62268.1 MAG: N-acetyltransferase [Persephonella sp.]